MLRALDVHLGQRALEVGTGTSWNAGHLASRIGPANVVNVEVDQVLADTARATLARHGLGEVTVVHGDGFRGYPAKAPYDRIVATCGLHTIPRAWIEQCRPGGVIVTPWGTAFTRTEATVALTVTHDGQASGKFMDLVRFMNLRSQRWERPEYADYVTAESREQAEQSSTALTLDETFGSSEWDIHRFVLGLLVPGCTVVFDGPQDGRQPVWLCSLTDRSWACTLFREGGKESTVYQYGERRLWDEVEAAYAWWREQDRPGLGRLGLTVTADGQRIWVDNHENPIRLREPA